MERPAVTIRSVASLFLVGMMGSGKSTVGRLLAERTGARFVDLDERLELIFGRTIADVVRRGEAGFRRLERAVLLHFLTDPGFASAGPWVVATGGGVVTDPDNVGDMRRAGTVVYLEVPVHQLAARLAGDTTRPLLSAERPVADVLAELFEDRRSAYESAGTTVDGTGTADEVAGRVLAVWSPAPS